MLEKYGRFSKAIDECLRPTTDPVGIKLLRTAADIPAGVKRPTEALGYRVAMCQAAAFARSWGLSLASLKEDMSCPIAGLVLGIGGAPDYWLDGNFHKGVYTDNAEVAGKIAKSMYRFEVGKYAGLVTAPLKACDFEIDMVWLHVNSAQLMRLIIGAIYRTGERFSVSVLPTAVCADVLVAPVETGKPQMGVPCTGARRYGRAADDDLIFSVPASRFDEIAEGLLFSHGTSVTYPIRQWLEAEPAHPEKYKQLMRDMGML